jgi:uracil phosphoribosyltransferase
VIVMLQICICVDVYNVTLTIVFFYFIIYQWGVPTIHVICVIASRAGLQEMAELFPDVHFTVGTIDDTVTEKGVLLPGLGDAGDRMFGTPLADDDEELLHPSKRTRSDA